MGKQEQQGVEEDKKDWLSNYFRENYEGAHNLTYNYLIAGYTGDLYNKFLNSVEDNATIIDIGIGNGEGLMAQKNVNLIFGKRLQIFGYDVDEKYLGDCRRKVNTNRLQQNVFLFKKDVSREDVIFSQKADYLFLSNSYAVIPNAQELLRQAVKKFNPVNVVVSTALEDSDSAIRRVMKPRLKYFTFGVDFGRMITQEQFEKEVEEVGLIIEDKAITNTPSFLGISGNVWTYIMKQKKRVVRKF
jgi:hypothetical protein